jgi:hypothetical protein
MDPPGRRGDWPRGDAGSAAAARTDPLRGRTGSARFRRWREKFAVHRASTNRLCILGGEEVRNSRGEGVTFISMDGIDFRAAG